MGEDVRNKQEDKRKMAEGETKVIRKNSEENGGKRIQLRFLLRHF